MGTSEESSLPDISPERHWRLPSVPEVVTGSVTPGMRSGPSSVKSGRGA